MSLSMATHLISITESHIPEDQKQINSFSKLNARLRGIEDRLEQLKVCVSPTLHLGGIQSHSWSTSKKKKPSTTFLPSSS